MSSRNKGLLLVFFMFFVLSSFSQKAERIISLAPSLTDNLYLIGTQDQLIGCTSYCKNAINDKKEIVGSAINANVEKIVTLNPDLVLAMQLTKPQDIETLERLGIKVVRLKTPKSFDEICKQLINLGKLTGKENIAKQVVKEEKNRIAHLKGKLSKEKSGQKIFFQIGANPIYTVIPNTFMDDYISFSGGINIASGLKQGSVSREAVVLKNPDLIIIASMGGFDQKEKEVWKSFNEINAIKNDKIFVIDSELACTPTPTNFRKSLEIIIGFLNNGQ